MGNPSNRGRRNYPVSLRCAAEAVFGPNAALRQLIDQQPHAPATSDKQEKTTCMKKHLQDRRPVHF